MKQLYEGKAKQILAVSEGRVLQRFKDSATAFNAEKKGEFDGKGRLNNRISSLLFRILEERGVATHFVSWENDRDMLVQQLTMLPLEVVVRNVVAGSLAKRFGVEEGRPLAEPVVELYYKRDDLGDPLLNKSHVRALGLASEVDVARCEVLALQVNTVLREVFASIELELVDFKLEFGRTADGTVLLADEISPDTCRLWDKATRRKMDKDVFRRDLGNLVEVYEEVWGRLSRQYPQFDPAPSDAGNQA